MGAARLLLLSAFLSLYAVPLGATPIDVHDIISNIKANESLYQNIELQLTRTYRSRDPDKGIPRIVADESESYRLVSQDGLFHVRSELRSNQADGDSTRGTYVAGYDGDMTRIVDDMVVNIRDDRAEKGRIIRPHTILFRWTRFGFPLSTYIAGGDLLSSYSEYKDYSVKVECGDMELVDGFNCFKIVHTTWQKGSNPASGVKRIISLAKERNYLPIRVEQYEPAEGHPKLPRLVGRVTKLEEVMPGVWFPMNASITVYRKENLASGPVVEQHTTDYKAEKVDLEPKYPRALFRNIDYPHAAAVYIIQNGRIVRSYREGVVEAPQKRSTKLWVILAQFIIIGIMIAIWMLARRRARTSVIDD
jgi:hypothetical protein